MACGDVARFMYEVCAIEAIKHVSTISDRLLPVPLPRSHPHPAHPATLLVLDAC